MRPRILLAAPGSGSGKTMISISVMAALKKRGIEVSGYKCGPDYIDPMYHRKVLGIQSRNLDPYFCDSDKLCSIVSGATGLSVIEGVMGYYDGIGIEGRCSTYDVAKAIKAPVVLIVNAKGMYTSLAPLIKGFLEYKSDSNIEGVIFNNTSEMMYKGLCEIARSVGVRPLGFMPSMPEISIESRHLGLMTADEIEDIEVRIDKLSDAALKYIDIDGLIALAESAEDICEDDQEIVFFDDEDIEADKSSGEEKVTEQEACQASDVVIAVARDEAFCFIYDENIKAIMQSGASIVYFSPLHDFKLPENTSGLYIPGGYPELYLDELSANKEMLEEIGIALEIGIPTIAECGGFMYLGKEIDGRAMVGAIDMVSTKKDRLQRFGYGEMVCPKDTLIAGAGSRIRVHEFHYYDSTFNGNDYIVTKASNAGTYPASIGNDRLYAGYPHLYFDGDIDIAGRFVNRARAFAYGEI